MISSLKIAECYVNKAKNAKARSIKFDMSLIAFANIKCQEVCAYSGLPFDDSLNGSLSLERIDNSIGYIDGNVIPVRREFNTLRGNLTLDTIHARIEQLNSIVISKEAKIVHHQTAMASEFTLAGLKEITSSSPKVFNKPKLNIKHLPRWKKYVDTLANTQRALESRMALIAETELLIIGKKGTPPGKNKLKNLRKLLNTHTTKADALKLAIDGAEKALEKFYKNCCKTSDGQPLNIQLPKIVVERPSNISFHEAQIELLRREIKEHSTAILNLKTIIGPALIKFRDLSDANKERIRLGLPINTTTYALLKHKVGYNCLIYKI
ncbi:putative antisigma factor [Acinetobacter phage Minot]|nr:putative antisigma factor [Acinetobacter phage Minot]QQO96472.1 putative anti-sigma factor [Acinetobacter phage Mokit]